MKGRRWRFLRLLLGVYLIRVFNVGSAPSFDFVLAANTVLVLKINQVKRESSALVEKTTLRSR